MKLIYIILFFSLISCNIVKDALTPSALSKQEKKELRKKERCNRKYERLSKSCPDLFDTTNVEVEVSVKVDSQKVTKVFKQNTDVSGIDSIITRYETILDSSNRDCDSLLRIVLSNMGNDLKQYVIERPCIPEKQTIDSVIFITIGNDVYSLNVITSVQSDKKGNITLNLFIPKTDFKAKTDFQQVQAKPISYTKSELIYLLWREIWWWIVIIVIVYIIYRIIIKRF